VVRERRERSEGRIVLKKSRAKIFTMQLQEA
jgi:hypothetical protein